MGNMGGGHAAVTSKRGARGAGVLPNPEPQTFFPETCCGTEAGSYLTLVSLGLRLKDLLGPVTRVKKRGATAPCLPGASGNFFFFITLNPDTQSL